ncbi:MAG: hypothetical protein M4D80_39965 [Myxococcota bacterium]|nr:hypothetical protein [Myxococcota bacterium]
MRFGGIAALLALALTAPPASADNQLYDRLWPRVPEGRQLKLSDQITDQLTELGNLMGQHMNALSHDVLAMSFDGRRRRAFVRIGGGDARFLEFTLASDVRFYDGKAQINARIDLTIAGNRMHLELPEMEMVPASYRGERGVEVRVPLFRRHF